MATRRQCDTGRVGVPSANSLLARAAPCRIVGVIEEEEDRWGFAYGTLPGHFEQGEEAFVVSRSTDGRVHFEVTAFSRPGETQRLSAPAPWPDLDADTLERALNG